MTQSSRKLLVIDDDTIVRQSIVAYLEDSGFDVHDESDGRSGLTWFENNHPDLVVTDLRMPDTDGLTILKMVREMRPDTPVIVISGMGVVTDVVEALRHGAADYLVKPLVDMEVLVHAINRALERTDLLQQNLEYRKKLEHANRELSEYVRVLERDQQAGRRVQSKLLPKTPLVTGNLNISYNIIPSLYLSGDFIDYALLAERYMLFYLTDVSGHGAASAFVTVWLRQLIRRTFREEKMFTDDASFAHDPARLIKLINSELIHSGIGCHMTCFIGVMDIETRQMHYVLGGHLPLPVLITDDGAEYLGGKGKPVGIFEDVEWEVSQILLPERFSLIVFSDGVLEILPPEGLIEKEEYLKDVLSKNECKDIESIYRELNIIDLNEAPDDIAILKVNTENFV